MEKKPLEEDDEEEKAKIAAMNEEEKIKAYMKDFTAEIPSECLQPADTPQKVMKVTKVETRVVMLKLKYGMDVASKVDEVIMRATENNEVSDEDKKYDEELVQGLIKALVQAGFIEKKADNTEDIDECEAETAKIKDKHRAKNEEKRQAKQKSEEQEAARQQESGDKDAPDEVIQGTELEVMPPASWLTLMVPLVITAAGVAVLCWWKSRKKA